MKAIKLTALALAVFLSTAFTTAQISNWSIAPNYSIRFSGTKVSGTLSGLNGTIVFTEADLEHAKMDIEVEVNTIKTGKDAMDKHAKNSSWFDVTKYPKITFHSTGFIKTSAGYSVSGQLTLHGVKKPVSIPFTFVSNGKEAEFVGSFKVNRKEYGINGNMFGFMVGDVFDVQLKVPVKG